MKLNLGGGRCWKRNGWKNLDIVLGYDLSFKRLESFKDNSVDLIYTSHCIEHLSWIVMHEFFSDMFRVLKINGIVRIVVPDMDLVSEVLTRNDKQYLVNLNPNYYNKDGRDKSPLIEDVKELVGYKGEHKSFFTFSILNIFLRIAGFEVVYKQKFCESLVEEIKEVAVPNNKGMPVSGFDNPNTRGISIYVEAIK